MKKIIVLLLLMTLPGFAQNTIAEREKCQAFFEKYEEQVKSRDYNDAKASLKVLQKECPKYDAKVYTYAEDIYNYEIEASRTEENRTAYIDTLITLYDSYEKNFPGNGSVVRKALLQKKHDLASDEKVYTTLNTFFTTHRDRFTDYDALQTYFMLYLDQYEAESNTISQKDFVEKYAAIAAQVVYAKNKLEQEERMLRQKQESEMLTDSEKQILADAKPTLSALDAVADNISIMASKHFSCSILSTYYSKMYEDNKQNKEWLSAVANVLYSNKCYDSEILYNAALAEYNLNPTSQSANRLGTILIRRNKTAEAVGYFEKSAEMEPDAVRKSEQYYTIAAVFLNTDKAKAKQYALKAAAANPANGKPYIMLAEMYSGVTGECGLSDFQRKALLYLSLEMAGKAAAAEPKYKATADVLKERYAEKLPSKKEAKAAGYSKGDTITYGCWINESLKLPKMQ